MELRKFTIQNVSRKSGIATMYSGFDFKHPYKRKEFNYTLIGNDGKTYYDHCYDKPKRYVENQIIRCWAERRGHLENEPKEYNLQYHSFYKTKLFTEYLFRKAVQDYIKCHKRSIERYKLEIKRLQSFL